MLSYSCKQLVVEDRTYSSTTSNVSGTQGPYISCMLPALKMNKLQGSGGYMRDNLGHSKALIKQVNNSSNNHNLTTV